MEHDDVNKVIWRNMKNQSEISKEWEKTESRMKLGFLLLMLLVVVAFFTVASTGVKSSAIDTNPMQAAIFTGEVTHMHALNNNTVMVNYTVKNSSKNRGLPNCNVYIQDPSASFPGYSAHLIINWTKAGKTSFGKISIPVSNPGSRYVTQGAITCN